ncbi:MAG: ACP S-malonyltransferase [Candidatus Rhabdochlamydia sp.]
MNKYGFIFPGQGSQYVGMCKDFYENFATARQIVEEASDCLSYSFKEVMFEGSLETLSETRYSQPAIFLMSAVILNNVQKEFPFLTPTACAGLSLGEYTALFAADKIDFISCLKLVALRGKLMQEACQEKRGVMRVVLGLDPDKVASFLPEGIWIANLNCPGQVVIAGYEEHMGSAEEMLKAEGARRILPLDVSGAFHTPLMKSAQLELKKALQEVLLKESPVNLVMNVSGEIVSDSSLIRSSLIEQVVSTTYWEKGIATLQKENITTYIEMGPGKTLAGMNKKMGVLAPTLSIEKISDLTLLESLYATT